MLKHKVLVSVAVLDHDPLIGSSIFIFKLRWRREEGGGGGGGGSPSPHFYGFARKDRDTLIEQSGSRYSNRAVTIFREAV